MKNRTIIQFLLVVILLLFTAFPIYTANFKASFRDNHKKDLAKLAIYQGLPEATRLALESQGLRGLTFYLIIDKKLSNRIYIDDINTEIVNTMLKNGAYRPNSKPEADIVFSLTNTSPKNDELDNIQIEVRDKAGNCLLTGSYFGRNSLSDDLSNLVLALSTEQQNKIISGNF